MSGRLVLIDGYNVIRADPTLSRLERESLENARLALIKAVAGSPRFLGDRVTIVFDGSGARSFDSSTRTGHVTATFSAAGSSADDHIKAVVSAARDRSGIVVVTNDADIREYSRTAGAQVTGSENLLIQLTSPRRIKREQPDREPQHPRTLSTVKTGNPRKAPKRARRTRDVVF